MKMNILSTDVMEVDGIGISNWLALPDKQNQQFSMCGEFLSLDIF